MAKSGLKKRADRGRRPAAVVGGRGRSHKKTAEIGPVHPAEYNPRRIEDDAMVGLGNSMRIFGDLSGFVVNETTGNIVCGHQRRSAIGDVDLARVDYGSEHVVMLGHPDSRFESREREGFVQVDDGGRFRVRLVRWPPEFEKAANLTANNPAIQGVFDDDKAAKLLEEIQQEEPEVFPEVMLDELLRKLAPKQGAGAEQDIPESRLVVVECDSETDQQQLYERLTAEGRNCRVKTL